MKIKTQELREAFKLIDFVPFIDAVESSRFVRCVTTENRMELHMASGIFGFAEIKVREGNKEKFFLERNALNGFLQAAKDGEEITLQTGKKHVLQQGRNKLELATPAQVSGYAVRPSGNNDQHLEFTAEEYAKLRMLYKYVPRKSVDERYSALQGIKGFGWIATDGLVLCAWKAGNIVQNTTIPSVLWQTMAEGEHFLIYGTIAVCKNTIGMLGQPLHNDLNAFPTDKVKGVAEQAFNAKPIVEVETAAWLEALRYFQGFSSGDGARVECELAKGQLSLRLSALGIKAETVVTAKVVGKSEQPLRWDLAKLIPWATGVGSKVIRLAVLENVSAFTTESKKDLLVMVTMTQ